METFNDVVDTLRFLNTVESENDLMVPPLSLASSTSSENKSTSNSVHPSSNSDQCYVSSQDVYSSTCDVGVNNEILPHASDGIMVLLFPWVDLCPSDIKTIVLVEDALKIVKSTRRCCRFIREVFICDYPPETLLNRPTIINTLLMIADGQQPGHSEEALYVLLCITRTLIQRRAQLFSIDLVHETKKVSIELRDSHDQVNAELEQITGGNTNLVHTEDALITLRQIPAPIFALNISHSILSIMSRSIMLLDSNENEVLSLKELNSCLSLIEALIQLLLDCVTEKFWVVEHSTKTHKNIAHKSCMTMRMLGDLMIKYKKSFTDNTERVHHRIAWLRLTSCAEKLLNWAKKSPLPPASLIVALQVAQLDPALELLYPELSKKINDSLLGAKTLLDREHKNKYKVLKKLFISMGYAVQFMKNKKFDKNSKEIFTEIKKSLPILGLHHNEAFLKDIANILLYKTKDMHFNESDWSLVRSIVLRIMAHNKEWVKIKFYQMLAEMVKSILFGEEAYQTEHEQCLILICDVGILTEICCHGLSSDLNEVNASASEIMLYLIRGRLVLSESCWWRLLASLLPILPLLHVYAAHDTQLGKAICKSLELEIGECMGVSVAEMVAGLTRLLFVKCAAVQLEAAHTLCRLLDDDRYLPPRESLRPDLLLNTLRRLEPQDFNIDSSSSIVRSSQTTGLIQIVEVLKQDLILDEDGKGYIAQTSQPTLEPSLRRSTLQQLSVVLRQQDSHETFLQHDGLNLTVSLLRLSLMIDDYLAFPECAISCVSILNSLSFASRHNLAKIADLPLMLLRVILVFPSNDTTVLMSAQVLALIAWSGFVLQEITSSRQKVPALPLCVTERTSLPFAVNSYWSTSPNTEHCPLEWLLSDDEWCRAIRVHWWFSWAGGVRSIHNVPTDLPAPSPTAHDLELMRTACVVSSSAKCLLALENATSHSQVMDALALLESYTWLVAATCASVKEYGGLAWQRVRRFLCAPPASSRDCALLITLLQFIIAYMDNVPVNRNTMTWIEPYFIGNDVTVISLLSRERLYPNQTPQEHIEVTQLHIHIVKIIWRCIRLLEYHEDYDVRRMESLLKILLSCLERIDLKNFHMLGYLNELTRCIRYALYSRYCKPSEETLLEGLKVLTRTLCGCGLSSGRKGQACKLDAMLALLALLRQIYTEDIPVQRWSEAWSGDVMQTVVACGGADRPEVRAAALHLMATLAHYMQLRPQLVQSIPSESLCNYAMDIFLKSGEANVVRASAAALLAAIAAHRSPHSDVHVSRSWLWRRVLLLCSVDI
ncbi:unnamed protein product [Parnassius mnemosyne]|uniref:Rotatin n=1 Tax=Parnassius mnemosyne TaxID=213953 RepID=A0AAV1KI73_9NEOP